MIFVKKKYISPNILFETYMDKSYNICIDLSSTDILTGSGDDEMAFSELNG